MRSPSTAHRRRSLRPQCEGSSRQPGVADECDDKGERADHGNRQFRWYRPRRRIAQRSGRVRDRLRRPARRRIRACRRSRESRARTGWRSGCRMDIAGCYPARPAGSPPTLQARGFRTAPRLSPEARARRCILAPRPGSEMSAGILRGPCFGQSDSSAVAKRTSSSTAGTRNIWF